MTYNPDLRGIFPDVWGPYLAFASGETVYVGTLDSVTGAFAIRWTLPCVPAGKGFVRIRDVAQVGLIVAYVTGDGMTVEVWNLTTGAHWTVPGWQAFPPGTYFEWPVGIGPLWIAVNGYGELRRYSFDGDLLETLPPLSTQGIAWVDALRAVGVDEVAQTQTAWGLLNPSYAENGAFCGEGITGGVPCVADNQKIILAEGDAYCFRPRIASQPDGTYHVVAGDYASGIVKLWTGVRVTGEQPEPEPEPEPGPVPPYTHVIYLEPGEAVLTQAVARRTGPMLRKLIK